MAAAAALTGPAARPGPVRNPLAGTAGPLAAFSSGIKRLTGAVRGCLTGVRAATRFLTRLAGTMSRTGTASKQFGTAASAAGPALAKAGKEATGAAKSLDRQRDTRRRMNRQLSPMPGKLRGLGGLLGGFGGLAGKAGGVIGTAGTSIGILDKIMQAVNLVMKGNPLMLLAGLLLPVATEMITLALESETGQRIMEDLFSQVGGAFVAASAAIVPPVRDCLTAVQKIWTGLKMFVEPFRKFLKGDFSGGFRSLGKALLTTLGGIADLIRAGFHLVAGVVAAPINALTGFINMIIDVLNKIPFVDLPHIPQLAQGGVVAPRSGGVPVLLAEAGEAEAVLPLSKLDRLLTATAEAARAGATRRADGPDLRDYREPAGRSAYGIAEDLLFLARTRPAAV
ncbi:hypothetical protein [Streptomyces huiliensis]|uniref:hypothetical protein n=1 Tax=Streptomyces huiliensis TaxID=2876027 RepID=UPI001CBCC1DA|nr:hypothetical protein [Streptomyces huiliensis]MBZ4320617.1 hypothetical protein [Streptomyces huiliensis]